jgi:hypothetical protein
MIRIVIGIFFCFDAFLVLVVNRNSPRAAYHGGELIAQFVFILAIGIALIVFGNRALALRKRVVEVAGRQLESSGSIDTSQIAREVGAPDARVRTILLRSGLANQVGKA